MYNEDITIFFAKAGLNERLSDYFPNLKSFIKQGGKEEVKKVLNSFNALGMELIQDHIVRREFQMKMFELFAKYARKHNSEETFKNIIVAFEKKGTQKKLLKSHPKRSRMFYSLALYEIYNFNHNDSNKVYSSEKMEYLYKAKKNLLAVYNMHISNKISLNKIELIDCLTYLAGCLTYHLRWSESLYYLKIIEKDDQYNPNLDYTIAKVLDEIKNKTCLQKYPLLLLKIADHSKRNIEKSGSNNSQLNQMEDLFKENSNGLSTLGVNLVELREHKEIVSSEVSLYSDYEKFCLENLLFLNEHSLFCNCKRATTDDLKIETNHSHTQLSWCGQFEEMIEVLVFDYINSRRNYYNSISTVNLNGFGVANFKRKYSRQKTKNALLKNSFKTCYSILDHIAYGITKAMNFDYKKLIKEKMASDMAQYGKWRKNYNRNLYFTTLWDVLDDSDINKNWFLVSLKSIAMDLEEDGALSDFKKIRNNLEHNILHISNEDTDVGNYPLNYNFNELQEKTILLLTLTKSAIFGFKNLIRQESKSR